MIKKIIKDIMYSVNYPIYYASKAKQNCKDDNNSLQYLAFRYNLTRGYAQSEEQGIA